MQTMIPAVKSLRTKVPEPSNLGRIASGVGLRQATTISSDPNSKHNMDKYQNPDQKTGDVMSQSFGEGYATRSDEEGFGGVFSDNQTLRKTEQIHENHPAYDKTQGSEVKEKEKGRCQTQANASTN